MEVKPIKNQEGVSLKVVVIDDDVDVLGLIELYLTNEGYDVFGAKDGIDGLERIRSVVPDVIICDVDMPRMSGDEVFEEVTRSSSEYRMIPFIFLTGAATEQDIISRLNLGAANCLVKPVKLSLLKAHINSCVSAVEQCFIFLSDRLDIINDSLHDPITYTFDNGESAYANVSEYIDVLASFIEQHTGASTPSINMKGPCRLDYVDFFLNEYQNRSQLVKTTNGEDLSWLLIYMVAKCQLEGGGITVSDLYVSSNSVKTTTHARINSLVNEGVLQKKNDLNDGRRQLVSLTDLFEEKLLNHIDKNINMISLSN